MALVSFLQIHHIILDYMGIGILSRDVIANVINFHNNEVNYQRKAPHRDALFHLHLNSNSCRNEAILLDLYSEQ